MKPLNKALIALKSGKQLTSDQVSAILKITIDLQFVNFDNLVDAKKKLQKLVNAKATLQKHSPTYLTGRKGQSLLCGAEYHNDIYAFLSSVKITDDQSLVGDTELFIGNMKRPEITK